MKRREFIGMAAMATAGLAVRPDVVPAERRRRKPNIIYILADDLGYGHLGCYGQKDIKTPNIDRMAAGGIKFTDHYAGSALCAPSRCALMTGLHTGHCFIRNNKSLPVEGNVPIPADSQTLAKVLKRAGYKTAAVGKWGLGYPGSEGDPVKQGFDLFFGYNCQRQAHSYYPDHLWRNDKKVILEGNQGGRRKDYSHDLLTAEALDFVRENHDRPFLLYLAYTIPHAAFEVPELGVYAGKDWPELKKKIAAMITRMDRDIGRMMELLKELRIERDTLVIFTSDNGSAGGALLSEFNGSGVLRGQKGTLYEGGIRVPMIARWPGTIKAGAVTSHVSAFWDMMPTFAELAGVELQGPTDGISLVPTLLGTRQQKRHEYLYWELKQMRAVRMGKWKAVRGKTGRLELFDLEADVSEKNDLASAHPEVVGKMRAIMERSHRDSPFFTWRYTGPVPPARPRPRRPKGRGAMQDR